PYNRGWHTPSWTIIDGTPAGATLHWIDAGVDSGDCALQRRVSVAPEDTAHSLYQRLLADELTLLTEALPRIKANTLPRQRAADAGTVHRKSDLAAAQRLDLDAPTTARRLIDLLRGLTTNAADEAAYFERGGR